MKRALSALAVLIAANTSSFAAAVAINLYVDSLLDQNGNPLPDGTLVQMIVDSANNGFGDPGRVITNTDVSSGSQLTPGSFVGGSIDDVVVASFAISSVNSGSAGGLFEAITIDYDPNFYRPGLTIAQGMPLLMRWWPGMTTSTSSSSVLAGSRFGEYRSSSVLDGSDIAWTTPPVGGLSSLNMLSSGSPGSSNVVTTANRTARLTAVPEPSSAVLAVAGGLAMLVRRRRK